MTLLDILNASLNGKRIVESHIPKAIGATIINVSLDDYEPIFEVAVKHPTGRVEIISYSHFWNIGVE
jgi:hypothetical protein